MAPRHRRVIWTLSAEIALDEAIAYVAADSPRAARKLLDRVLAAVDSLSTLSERGSRVSEVDDPTIRQVLSDPYRVIYQVRENEVVILALLHQRQDVERWGREYRP